MNALVLTLVLTLVLAVPKPIAARDPRWPDQWVSPLPSVLQTAAVKINNCRRQPQKCGW